MHSRPGYFSRTNSELLSPGLEKELIIFKEVRWRDISLSPELTHFKIYTSKMGAFSFPAFFIIQKLILLNHRKVVKTFKVLLCIFQRLFVGKIWHRTVHNLHWHILCCACVAALRVWMSTQEPTFHRSADIRACAEGRWLTMVEFLLIRASCVVSVNAAAGFCCNLAFTVETIGLCVVSGSNITTLPSLAK